jgi:hypothetical protein
MRRAATSSQGCDPICHLPPRSLPPAAVSLAPARRAWRCGARARGAAASAAPGRAREPAARAHRGGGLHTQPPRPPRCRAGCPARQTAGRHTPRAPGRAGAWAGARRNGRVGRAGALRAVRERSRWGWGFAAAALACAPLARQLAPAPTRGRWRDAHLLARAHTRGSSLPRGAWLALHMRTTAASPKNGAFYPPQPSRRRVSPRARALRRAVMSFLCLCYPNHTAGRKAARACCAEIYYTTRALPPAAPPPRFHSVCFCAARCALALRGNDDQLYLIPVVSDVTVERT